MAIYHLEAKVISRGTGRSAVAASAYLSCSKILNDYDGVQHDYTRKKGLVWQEVFLPEFAPSEWKERGVLWNAVEENEKTKDSRLAREFVVALPIELSEAQWEKLLSDFISGTFVADGMCADVAIHDPYPPGHNPHAHIMLTVRPLDEKGSWQYKTQKEYLCVKNGEEQGFTADEFKIAQTEGWEKQYQYKVGRKKVYLPPSEAENHGYERASKHPKSTKFENGTVNFEANDSYYLGAPKTKYVNFLQTQEDDKLNGVVTGTVDITDPSFSSTTVDAIKAANKNDDVNGPAITTDTVDNLGYGYLGMSANTMNVNKEPGSDASKAYRKAFATVLAAYRTVAIESYYGERASVINYPISNTSWAAPQAADPGYKVAFSVDAQGKDIYTSDMTDEQKYEAALQAALGFFEAAGCKVENGKVVSNPEGGMDTANSAIEREALIPADGKGDHPSFMILTEASKALEKIGVHLIVTDLSDSTQLWDTIEADQADMWAAAWSATPDPDMYQIYFSGMDGKAAGGSNYMYDINDAELNQLILDARNSLDQSYRKTLYKSCLDIIVDWAVEVPVYQRQNAIIFSTQRVNMNTVTPDITTFYGWLNEVEKIELN